MFALSPFERKSYDLFNAFHDFERDFFGEDRQINSCKTDIRDEGDHYVLEAELPGFEKNDIKLDISDGFLKLSAEHSTVNDEKDKDGKYIRRERSYGSYQRNFDISGINADGIEAEYKNGILFVDLPKKEIAAPESKRLEIK